MTREKLLSVLDIAKELKAGKTTTKFLLKRFQKWLPYKLIDGHPFYPDTIVKQVFVIQENLEMGMLPSDIEKKLDTLSNSNIDDILNHFENSSQNGDIRLSNDGLSLLKSLFTDIGEQQKRIAIAHEKRAEAEERKAEAIEKRAEAEEKKAEAMNNIANALQEMNKVRTGDPATQQIAHQTASIIADDELSHSPGPQLDDNLSDPINDLDENLQIDDLSLLIEDDKDIEQPEDTFTPLDDLSLLLDETKKQNNEIDDLSKLIDETPLESIKSIQLDDLSLLIDKDSEKDEDRTDQHLDLDDLSKLIDDSSDSEQPAQTLDDLSLLITHDSLPMDDLSKLIDDPKTIEEPSSGENESKDTPEIKIDIAPEENLEKYKAAVMKVIIEFKTDGLSAEQTTIHLNKNKLKTLSGKPEWSQKAISQIYKFIESAK
ncbi:MAG: hypothetical protein KAJ25_10675 [Desulfobacula sp.]|nr:hypothetical protein [Desulfobacula sp.]MCK5349845.1 hypothetical protein [Desulfobacula sp.]